MRNLKKVVLMLVVIVSASLVSCTKTDLEDSSNDQELFSIDEVQEKAQPNGV
ncbi:hypothetical protein [Neotamlana sedimentorum]|uniref:hypothetical protein n=1 Tax=Neotamlana sedimentorum TaxID=1435349 RepID=UPI0013F4189D|nr:hypothetical protein [Tamlana sedimentorum]